MTSKVSNRDKGIICPFLINLLDTFFKEKIRFVLFEVGKNITGLMFS